MSQNHSHGTLSYAHERKDLRERNPLYTQAPSLRSVFEAERCPLHARQLADVDRSEAERRREVAAREHRRDSFMIKRQQPKPVLKPSHALAYGPDRAAFNVQLREDNAQARSNNQRQAMLKSAYAVKGDLEKGRAQLRQQEQNRRCLNLESPGAQRELFKIERNALQVERRTDARYQNHIRRHGER